MNTQTDADFPANAILFRDLVEEPLAVWTLNELDTDLDSVRYAWAYTDNQSPLWAE